MYKVLIKFTDLNEYHIIAMYTSYKKALRSYLRIKRAIRMNNIKDRQAIFFNTDAEIPLRFKRSLRNYNHRIVKLS